MYPPLHRMEEKTSRRLPRATYADALAETGRDSVETTVHRKRGVLFAGIVARMGSERIPKRVKLGEVEGETGHSRGQERDWMGLSRNLFSAVFKLPTEAEYCCGCWSQETGKKA